MWGAFDMAGNVIKDEGGVKVAEALSMNTTLTHLDLSSEEGWWDAGVGVWRCG